MNTRQNESSTSSPAASRRRAGTVHALAGTTGMPRRHGRGSFLVLVVGTLALMSVFAVVYIAIERADTGASVGLIRNAARDDVPKQFVDYVGGIISDDLFAVAPIDDPIPAAQSTFAKTHGIRKAWTNPGIDPDATVAGGAQSEKFTPVGRSTSPWLASTMPTALQYATGTDEYLQYKDMMHLSAFAPDGMPVNLHNLRNNFGATAQQMRVDLSLRDKSGKVTAMTDFGEALPPLTPASKPWYYWSRQQAIYRPTTALGGSPDSADYLPYQYVSTTGDGMYNARLFELTEARDNNPDHNKKLLDASDKYRWFFAATAIDLSSLINVSTAGDFVTAPSDKYPVGLTPAEVDIRRMLTLEDFIHQATGSAPGWKITNASPGGFVQPSDFPGQPNNLPQDYTDYNGTSNTGARQIGEWAYTGLYQARGEGYIPPAGADMGATPALFLTPKDRFDFYDSFAAIDGAVVHGTSGYRVGALFSADDLLDLNTFRGSNNPDITSTLERITGGRYLSGSGTGTTADFGVLRDNRPLMLERNARDLNGDGIADPKAMLALYADPRLYITSASGDRPLFATIIDTSTTSTDLDQLAQAEVKVSPTHADGPRATFKAYAGALIPFSNDADAWAGATKFNSARTQNYGYTTAELGLQMAANMAVNLEHVLKRNSKPDWHGGQPLAYTVLVHEDFRTKLEGDWAIKGVGGAGTTPKSIKNRQYKSAWWVEKSDTSGALDVGNAAKPEKTQLAKTGTSTVAAAMNVFGVHPEPVLTSVASFIMYTDASVTANGKDQAGQDMGIGVTQGGDVDGKGDSDNIPPDAGEPVTIKGNIAKDNPDVVFELIAFQITNPYVGTSTDTITLFTPGRSGADTWYDYYLDFGNLYYRVAKVNRVNPATLEPVELKAGKTRTLFATNVSLDTAAKRLRNASRHPDGSLTMSPAVAKKHITDWIDRQLAIEGHSAGDADWNDWEPIWIEPFSATQKDLTAIKKGLRNAPYTDAMWLDFLQGANTDKPAFKTARLRAMRSVQGVGPGAGVIGEMPKSAVDPLPEQFLENDLLVDRISDYQQGTQVALDCRLPAGQHDITGTKGFAEDAMGIPNDNTGFSLVKYGLIRRPADMEVTPPIGGAPSYMFETRFGNTLNVLCPEFRAKFGGKGDNDFNQAFFYAGGKDKTKASPRQVSAGKSLLEMIKIQNGSVGVGGGKGSPVLPYQSLRTEPSKWNSDLTEQETRIDIRPASQNVNARIAERRPQLPSQIPEDQFRLGDVLLPLAIGPVQFIFDPALNPNAPNLTTTPGADWITTGEMMALATGHDWINKNNTTPGGKAYVPLYYAFSGFTGSRTFTSGTVTAPMTDHGQLSIDRFVPFYDSAGSVLNADPSTFPKFDANAGDSRRGMGIPPGLAALDGFIAPAMARHGSITRAIPGRINVATAPVPVLRTVPMLSPTTETGTNSWWGAKGGSIVTELGVKSDIAVTLAAYRDKVLVPYRAGSPRTAPTGGSALTADFTDGGAPNKVKALDGREVASGIEGVRELPGIRSLGEIMMARYYNPDGFPATPPDYGSIDNLGRYDGTKNHVKGVDSMLYDDKVTNTKSSYAQKLAIANGAFNSITTRSDLFGVWFVVQGYQRSDVEGLGKDDPMIPSVQRRFFMVIDRSEVVKKGQKPRIVLMRELPM